MTLDDRLEALVDRMLTGDRRALARLITRVENRVPGVPEVMRRAHPRTGRAYTVGITGPPGAGKSTLVDRLIAAIRKTDATVGVTLHDRVSSRAHTPVVTVGGTAVNTADHTRGHGLGGERVCWRAW